MYFERFLWLLYQIFQRQFVSLLINLSTHVSHTNSANIAPHKDSVRMHRWLVGPVLLTLLLSNFAPHKDTVRMHCWPNRLVLLTLLLSNFPLHKDTVRTHQWPVGPVLPTLLLSNFPPHKDTVRLHRWPVGLVLLTLLLSNFAFLISFCPKLHFPIFFILPWSFILYMCSSYKAEVDRYSIVFLLPFLINSGTHLYKMVRLSIRRSVGWSVSKSVMPF